MSFVTSLGKLELFNDSIFLSVPLLHVLSLHVRLMINEELPVRLTNDDSPVWTLWASLCGIQIYDNTTLVPSRSNELIPILLSDPCALMLKFILLAPLQLDLGKSSIWLPTNISDRLSFQFTSPQLSKPCITSCITKS